MELKHSTIDHDGEHGEPDFIRLFAEVMAKHPRAVIVQAMINDESIVIACAGKLQHLFFIDSRAPQEVTQVLEKMRVEKDEGLNG